MNFDSPSDDAMMVIASTKKQAFLNSFSMAASKKNLNTLNNSQVVEFDAYGNDSQVKGQQNGLLPKIISEPDFAEDLSNTSNTN